jgi:hypothetical protein
VLHGKGVCIPDVVYTGKLRLASGRATEVSRGLYTEKIVNIPLICEYSTYYGNFTQILKIIHKILDF